MIKIIKKDKFQEFLEATTPRRSSVAESITQDGMTFDEDSDGEPVENTPQLVLDDGEKMTTDEVFQSMVLEQSIRKFVDSNTFDNFLEYEEFKHLIPADCEHLRTTIPSTADIKIKPSVLWKLAKECIGKDLSKIAMPVFINEPVSILQKAGEFAYYCQEILPKAVEQDTAIKRMLYLTVLCMSPGN